MKYLLVDIRDFIIWQRDRIFWAGIVALMVAPIFPWSTSDLWVMALVCHGLFLASFVKIKR